LELHIDRRRPVPLWRQIYEQLRERILTGSLPPGTLLPPERHLAASLGVNRATVVQAYRELAADGLVAARVGSGTRVLPQLPAGVPGRPAEGGEAEAPAAPFDWTALLALPSWPPEPPLLREARAVRSGSRQAISLARGELAPELLPTRQLQQLLREAAEADLPWGYGPVAGYGPLRQAIAQRMGRTAPDEVVITAGAQHGLALIVRALTEPGDAVVVENPSYYRSLTLFTGLGLRVLPVPVDREGIRTDALAAVLDRHRPRLIFVTPNFQNPTGASLSPLRRRQLLTLARLHRVPVVEADSYGELWFEAPQPPLRELDPTGPVIYVGSFSKTVAPGLRIGWVVAPPPVAERLAAVQGQQENGLPLVGQWVLAEFLRRGWLDEHLARLRQALRERRDALVAALARHLPESRWQVPGGGYHLWLEPEEGISALAWFRAAARAGVLVMPGDLYGSPAGLRLSFSCAAVPELEEGVRRLARAREGLRREGHPGDVEPVI